MSERNTDQKTTYTPRLNDNIFGHWYTQRQKVREKHGYIYTSNEKEETYIYTSNESHYSRRKLIRIFRERENN